MHITCVILFVNDNVAYVPSQFMPHGVRKAWAAVWSCGGVFSRTMHITCVTLFVYDNVAHVLSRFMPHGVWKAWAGVWSCGGIFSCLWWGLLYPYRIITLGSNKHNGDDGPLRWFLKYIQSFIYRQ
jgi:hypothetical protein